MSAAILVATPYAAFGELIRISLEDNGQYDVRLVDSGREAKDAASNGHYQLAILDAALTDMQFIPLCKDILELQKGIRLVVIPPENNVNHPSLGGLMPHGYLNRPFYLPDMLDTVNRLISERDVEMHAPQPFSPTLPTWLQEPIQLQAYLEQELGNTEALAGMIGIYGASPDKNVLKGWAGQFSAESASEMLATVFRYWNRDENTDLMRFIRLTAEKNDYLVYATRMIGEYILVLAYDTKAPLSLIRPQTKNIAQQLSYVPPQKSAQVEPPALEPLQPDEEQSAEEQPSARELPPAKEQPSAEELPPAREQQPAVFSAQAPEGSGWFAEELEEPPASPGSFAIDPGPGRLEREMLIEPPVFPGKIEQDISEKTPVSPGMVEPDIPEKPKFPWDSNLQPEEPEPARTQAQPLDDEILFSRVQSNFAPFAFPEPPAEENEKEIPNLTELLASDPQPGPEMTRVITPTPGSSWHEWQNAAETALDQPVTTPATTGNVDDTRPTSPEATPNRAPANGQPQGMKSQAGAQTSGGRTPVTEKNLDLPTFVDLFHDPEPAINPLEDTRPHLVASLTNISQLEPISPALSQLNYTCVLIPRIPQHYLTGELADSLSQWVPQFCLAYAWRLEGISIRPEYLLWTVQVAPSISPGNLVRIVRQRSSQSIFNQYNYLREQNPSGDFWASGYLIVSGAQPPSAQLLREYISQTRKRQGVIK